MRVQYNLRGVVCAAYRVVFACAIVAFGAGVALAIPNQHLNPHNDDPAVIAFPSPAPADPNTTNHIHLDGSGVVEVGGLLKDAGNLWRSDSVWDDRFYRFADANADEVNDLAGAYGHGYIDASFAPRYDFANDVAAAAKTLIDQAMALWDFRAKQEGQYSRTAPDGTGVQTGVVFERATGGGFELTIDFVEGYQEQRNAAAEWIVSSAQTYVGGPGTMTLAFETTPTVKISVDAAGWLLSTDGKALDDATKTWLASTAAMAMGWSYDKNPDVLYDDVDFDYMSPTSTAYEGDEAAFLALGLDLKDSWGESVAAATLVDIFEADFFSVAIHEWGHVIGLLHSQGGTMDAASPFTFNNTLQSIDNSNALGAAALYSIPIAEPATLLLLGTGLIGLRRAARRRRERNAQP